MATIQTNIWKALKARIDTLSQVKDMPNSGYIPSDDIYLEVRHLPNYSDRMTIDSTINKYKGILQLTLCFPISKKYTHEQMQEQAGLIAASFQQGLILPFAQISVEIEKQPDITQSFRDEGFLKYPVVIRYFCFT